jgi:hypothetical protein
MSAMLALALALIRLWNMADEERTLASPFRLALLFSHLV